MSPEPYYQDDFATIYHGDCLDVLEGVSIPTIDAVVTDPPYASGARMEAPEVVQRRDAAR